MEKALKVKAGRNYVEELSEYFSMDAWLNNTFEPSIWLETPANRYNHFITITIGLPIMFCTPD